MLCSAMACAAARAGHWTLTCWLAAEALLTPVLLVAALVLLRHVDRFAAAGAGALRGTRVRAAAGPLSMPRCLLCKCNQGRPSTRDGASRRQAGAVMDALSALGLGRGAGPAEVRQTYRALAKGCAPALLRRSRARGCARTVSLALVSSQRACSTSHQPPVHSESCERACILQPMYPPALRLCDGAARLHPDQNPDPAAHERFRRISAARRLLLEEQERDRGPATNI